MRTKSTLHDEPGDIRQALRDKGSQFVDDARGLSNLANEAAAGTIDDVRRASSERLSVAKDIAKRSAGGAQRRIRAAFESGREPVAKIARGVRERPLRTALVAAGVGALVAIWMRRRGNHH
jgi:ElaB/YqjD/DUF883 family membrane-anchored ribosome-binding protein